MLDKRFDGVKFDLNSGISSYGDGASYKAGVAAGTSLFDGRGPYRRLDPAFHADGILHNARPEGPLYYLLTGAGSAANPFTTTINARLANSAYGGKITCTACTVNGQQFTSPGVIGRSISARRPGQPISAAAAMASSTPSARSLRP